MKTLITSKPVSDGQKSQFATVVADAVRKHMGMLVDQLSNAGVLNSENFQGVLGSGDRVVAKVQVSVEQFIIELTSGIKGCLQFISGGRRIFIRPTDGTETIAEASDVFQAIHPDYNNLGLNRRSNPTKRQEVGVYRLLEDANLLRIFTSLGKNLDSLCLTQAQIKAFCRDHYHELENSSAKQPNLFLFKSGHEFYVAWVYRSGWGEDRPTAFFVYPLNSREQILHGSSNKVFVILPEL